MSNLLKVSPNERVDLGDFEFITDAALEDDRRFNREFVGGDDSVIGGFFYTITPPFILTVARGKAITADPGLTGSTPVTGQLVSEGLATQQVDFTGLAADTYSIWIRFVYGDGVQENRVFWNPQTDQEQVLLVPTRQVASWSLLLSQTSPGPEWVEIFFVTYDAVSLASSIIEDRRGLFFDGDATGTLHVNGVLSSLATFTPTWGGGSDRDNDRSQNGITDLKDFVEMVRQKFEEIQTGTNPSVPLRRWWETPTNSLDDMLPLSGATGDKLMRGNIQFDTNGVYLIGDTGNRPLAVVAENLDIDVTVQFNDSLVFFGGSSDVTFDGGIIDFESGTTLDFKPGTTVDYNTSNVNFLSGAKQEFKTGSALEIEDGASLIYQSSNDLAWTGSGDLLMTGGGAVITDEVQPNVAAGSFIGQSGNRFAQGFFDGVSVTNGLDCDDLIVNNSIDAQGIPIDLDTSAVSLFGGTLSLLGGTVISFGLGGSESEMSGILKGTAQAVGQLGADGRELLSVAARTIRAGFPLGGNSLTPIRLWEELGVVSPNPPFIEFNVTDPGGTPTKGAVFEMKGFDATVVGVNNGESPWTRSTPTPGGAAFPVGALRLEEVEGIDGGDPLWIFLWNFPYPAGLGTPPWN